MAGLCEECTACCTVFEVKDVNKGFNTPCKHLGHTTDGPGCTIYSTRPEACNHYMCAWLFSRINSTIEDLPDELRPDRTKVVLGWPYGIDRNTMYVYPLPDFSNNWRYPPVSDYLQMILSRGGKVIIIVDGKRIAIRGTMAIIGTEQEFEKLQEDTPSHVV